MNMAEYANISIVGSQRSVSRKKLRLLPLGHSGDYGNERHLVT